MTLNNNKINNSLILRQCALFVTLTVFMFDFLRMIQGSRNIDIDEYIFMLMYTVADPLVHFLDIKFASDEN